MDNKIETYGTLWSLVDLDTEEHKAKGLATVALIEACGPGWGDI